ncbi:MAG: hypothetical protein ACD_73C00079G0005, partial [uncultured bacterium]
LKNPEFRRKPVLAALPPGITLEDIRKEMAELLVHDADIDVTKASLNKKWAGKATVE